MTAFRVLAVLVVVSAIAKLGELAAAWPAPAIAAGTAPRPLANPPASEEAGCGPDARGLRELLESVRAKHDELARREADLDTREAGLRAMRQVVTGEVARLEAVAKSLGITDGSRPSTSIVRVLEAMAPEDAAPILERLDDGMLRQLLGRMRERNVAALLPILNRDRAVAVTKSFAAPLATPSR